MRVCLLSQSVPLRLVLVEHGERTLKCACSQLQDEERRRQQLEEMRRREAEDRARQEAERARREEERARREAEDKVLGL